MLQPDTGEIEEDFASGDSGSTKNSKKVQPLFSDPNNASPLLAPGYQSPNSPNLNTQQFTEDPQNQLHEELRNG